MKKLMIIITLSIVSISSCQMPNPTVTLMVEDKLYRCMTCGHEFRRDSSDYNKTCPVCNSPNTEIIDGNTDTPIYNEVDPIPERG